MTTATNNLLNHSLCYHNHTPKLNFVQRITLKCFQSKTLDRRATVLPFLKQTTTKRVLTYQARILNFAKQAEKCGSPHAVDQKSSVCSYQTIPQEITTETKVSREPVN
jgi:hypothetical protein